MNDTTVRSGRGGVLERYAGLRAEASKAALAGVELEAQKRYPEASMMYSKASSLAKDLGDRLRENGLRELADLCAEKSDMYSRAAREMANRSLERV